MNRIRKKTLIFSIILGIFLIICIFLYFWFFYVPEFREDFPDRFNEFEIQGLTWRSEAYFYNDFIYMLMYSEKNNYNFLSKARNSGANYMLIRAVYNSDSSGNLQGDDEQARVYLSRAIKEARKYDMKIFLTPFVESIEFFHPEFHWTDYEDKEVWILNKEDWEEKVLYWAEFAEENGVELFAPGFEMSLILDEEQAADFYKEIVPKIREVYNGKIVFAEIPYGEEFNYLNQEEVFQEFDCIGITAHPWKDYDGVHDLRGYLDLNDFIKMQSEITNNLSKKYGTDCKIIATFGIDDWYGGYPGSEIYAGGYNSGLDIFKKNNFTGVFLHLWASEESHLGDKNDDVEKMLKKRWLVSN